VRTFRKTLRVAAKAAIIDSDNKVFLLFSLTKSKHLQTFGLQSNAPDFLNIGRPWPSPVTPILHAHASKH